MATKSPDSTAKRNMWDVINVLGDGVFDASDTASPEKKNKTSSHNNHQLSANTLSTNEGAYNRIFTVGDDISPRVDDQINSYIREIPMDFSSPNINNISMREIAPSSSEWVKDYENSNVPLLANDSNIFQSNFSATPKYKHKTKQIKDTRSIQNQYEFDMSNNIVFSDIKADDITVRNVLSENRKALNKKLVDNIYDTDSTDDDNSKGNNTKIPISTPTFLKIPVSNRRRPVNISSSSTVNDSKEDLILRVEQMKNVKPHKNSMILDSLSLNQEKPQSLTKRSVNINNNIINTNKLNISNTTAFESDRKNKLDDATTIAMAANALAEISSPKKGLRESLSETPEENSRNSSNKSTENKSTLVPTVTRCNCKKSRCLKLYCDCFKIQIYCNGCNCNDCANLPQFELERKKAVDGIVERNPIAFKPRVSESIVKNVKSHSSGCHCKRSNCLKKYCECFANDVACFDRCRCQDCKNTNDTKQRSFSTSPTTTSQLLSSLGGKPIVKSERTVNTMSKNDNDALRNRADSFISATWSTSASDCKTLGVSSSGGTITSNGSALANDMNSIYLNSKSNIKYTTSSNISENIKTSKSKLEYDDEDFIKSPNKKNFSDYILSNNSNNSTTITNDNLENGFHISRVDMSDSIINSSTSRRGRNLSLNHVNNIIPNNTTSSSSSGNSTSADENDQNDTSNNFRYLSPETTLTSQTSFIRSVSSMDREAGEILLALSPQQSQSSQRNTVEYNTNDRSSSTSAVEDKISTISFSQGSESSHNIFKDL